jgi:hypothetical protein
MYMVMQLLGCIALVSPIGLQPLLRFVQLHLLLHLLCPEFLELLMFVGRCLQQMHIW